MTPSPAHNRAVLLATMSNDFVFNYSPPPTLKRFMLSDKSIRIVRGPVGCLSGDTEYLSPFGWRRIDQYAGGPVAQWEDGLLSFVMPLGYINAPCVQPMYQFSTVHALSMRVTGNHRVPVYDWAGKFRVKDAEQLARKPSRHVIPTTFIRHTSALELTEIDIRLRVMIAADGFYPARGSQAVVCVRKDRKKQRFRWLMQQAQIEYSEVVRTGRPTETVFTFKRPPHPKPLGAEWYSASSEQLGILLDEMQYWDGLYEGPEMRFSTAKPQEADVVQFAAHATGRRATISKVEYPGKKWNPTYTVQIASGRKAKVCLRGEAKVTRVKEARQYCFTVPSTFFLARHNGRVFVTGNSGKSSAMVVEILRRGAQQAPDPTDGIRRTRWAIVRNTLPQLKDTCLKTMREMLGPIMDYRVSERTVWFRFGDIEIECLLMPLDTPEDVKRLLSLDLTGGWVSELREIPLQIVLDVFSRCGRFPSQRRAGASWYGVIGETNSFNEESEWNAVLEEKDLKGKPLPDSWDYFVQPGAREPNAENRENLIAGYYENLIDSNSPQWVEQYVDNLIAPSLAGEAVFRSSFKDSFHVADHDLLPVPGTLAIAGMDFARHPAAVITQMDPKGRLLILEEAYGDNMGVEQFINTEFRPIFSRPEFARIPVGVCGDPAGVARSQVGEESVFGALKRLGLSAQPAQTNSIDPRLRAVERWLLQQRDGGPAVLISPRCTRLIQALRSKYRYAKKKDGDLQPLPEKRHPWSDLADAFQYACLGQSDGIRGRFLKPRMDTQAGQRKSSAGWT